MPEITRRRADQLRDFVTVLKFRAIDFDERARAAKQDFCGGFHNSGFSGTGRAQKQQVSDWTARHGHSREVDLIHVYEPANCPILPYNLAHEPAFEVEDIRTPHLWIEG